jgi:WD40 repeat protein
MLGYALLVFFFAVFSDSMYLTQQTHEPLQEIECHSDSVRCLAISEVSFCSENHLVWSGSLDGTACLWEDGEG